MRSQYLDDQELLQCSDSVEVNDDDRRIQTALHEIFIKQDKFSRFLGVPLRSTSGKTQGVLMGLSQADAQEFTQCQRQVLQEFANNVSLLLADTRRQALNRMLIEIGQRSGADLLQYVVERMPGLVRARGVRFF